MKVSLRNEVYIDEVYKTQEGHYGCVVGRDDGCIVVSPLDGGDGGGT